MNVRELIALLARIPPERHTNVSDVAVEPDVVNVRIKEGGMRVNGSSAVRKKPSK